MIFRGALLARRVRVLLLAFLLAGLAAQAQTTWGSLHFGMTLAQARAALAGKIVSEKPAESTILILARPVKLGSASGEPRLSFDAGSGKLLKIVWDFSIPAEGCFTKYDSKRNASRMVSVSEIGNKYAERYGRPSSETGAWPTADQLYDHFVGRKSAEEFTADRTWRADDQIVTVSLRIHCDNVSLLVQYEPERKTPSN